jgi:hypothetical protein
VKSRQMRNKIIALIPHHWSSPGVVNMLKKVNRSYLEKYNSQYLNTSVNCSFEKSVVHN